MTKKAETTKQEAAPQQPSYMYKMFKYKEYLWLGFAILSLIISVYELIQGTRDEAMYFIALTLLAGLFYSFNRYRRKKYDKEAELKNSKS